MAGGIDSKCGLTEFLVFCAALVAGTGCSLTSKIMLDMESVGMTGETEKFSYPLFQTFGMFTGMTAGLIIHFILLHFKIPFPGYTHSIHANTGADAQPNSNSMPMWMYFLLIIPALFDLVATALCMFGLRYVNVSIYQMLRGSAIIFIAIIKHFGFKDRLKRYMWVGVFWNVVSIVLVGATAVFSAQSSEGDSSSSGGDVLNNDVITGNSTLPGDFPLMNASIDSGASDSLFGVFLILSGAFVQSLQYAFEEKVMSMEVAAPPLLLIGMEGLWGTIVCVFILYPCAYYLPGADHGSIENPFNTIAMFQNSSDVQHMFCIYFFFIFAYNVLAVLVTYLLNSIWHAILDNFRPITVWGTDLVIFYFITTAMGEEWTIYSWIQLSGMIVLLYGTAIYNAPNACSIQLEGSFLHFFIDCSDEYEEAEVVEMVDEKGAFVAEKSATGYMSTMSPFMSPSVRRGPNTLSPRAAYSKVNKEDITGGYGSFDKISKNRQGSFA